MNSLGRIVVALVCAVLGASLASVAYADEQDAELLKNIETIESALNTIAVASRETIETLAAEPTDVAELQRQLGTDRQVLHDWVIDSVRWVPYQGALKGADGTFLSRQANLLDQALLLASLYASAGFEVRIGSRDTSVDERDMLFSLVQSRFERDSDTSAYDAYLTRHRGALVDTVRSAFGQVSEQKSARAERDATRVRVEQQIDTIRDIAPDVMNPIDDASVKQLFMDSLTQFHWVESRNNDGSWARHSVLGEQEYVEALMASGDYFARDAVPAALMHTVRLQVELDTRPLTRSSAGSTVSSDDDAKTITQTVLNVELQPYRYANRPIALQFQASGALDSQQIVSQAAQSDSIVALRADDLEQHDAWVPTLVLSRDEVVRQNGFTTDGQLFEYAEELLGGLDDTVSKKVGGALDVLSSEPASDDATDAVSAVRIMWTIASPGMSERVIERVLYRASPFGSSQHEAASTVLAEALAAESQYYLQSARIPWFHVELATARDFQQRFFEIRHVLSRLKKTDPDTVDLASFFDVIGKRQIIPAELAILAALRNDGLGSGYLAEPNILTALQQVRLDEDQTSVRVHDSTDIVANQCRFAISSGREQQVRAGVWDTASEALLKQDADLVHNTIEALGDEKSDNLAVIKTTGDVEGLHLSEAQRQAMLTDLQLGYWLLLPRDMPGETGTWWRVDSSSGNTLGQGMGVTDVGGIAMSELNIKIARLYLSMAQYTWGMAQCSVNNRGNARAGLGCALCATTGVAIQQISRLGVLNGLESDLAGFGLSQICR